jgi:hypothetical protein
MKYRALHGGALEFFNTTADLAAAITTTATNSALRLYSASGIIELGDGTPSDIQLGAVGTSVTMKFMGGGAIGANGQSLNFGQSGDTVNLNVSGVTYNFPSTLARLTDFAAPPAIGNTTPNSGNFTTLVVNNTAVSTNTTNGSLTVKGGIGVADSVYVGNRVGFAGTATNVSAAYQVYNYATNSIDMIFG